jgi:hypothetical protein
MSAPFLSELTPSISFIWDLYAETSDGLRNRENKLREIVKAGQSPGGDYYRFMGMSDREIKEFFVKAQQEIDALVVFDLLSAAEGRLRDDFEKRVEDAADISPLTRDFRVIAKHCVRDRKSNPHNLLSLLGVWAAHSTTASHIQVFKSYWPFRNWLAHGRWFGLPEGRGLPPPEYVKNSVTGLLRAIGIPFL